MNAEIEYFATNKVERVFLVEQGETYLVKPYMLESDGSIKVPHRYFPSYALAKSMEGVDYAIYLQEEEINMGTKFNFSHLHENLNNNKYGAYQEKIFEKDLNTAIQNDYQMNQKQAELVISHSKNICKDKGFEINAQELTAVAEDFGYTAKNIIHAK